MDTRWFKEDRENYPRSEQREQINKSKEALLNSTLLRRRLTNILEEDLNNSYLQEEDYENAAWERLVIAAAAERKVLRRIIKLLDFKEVKTDDR